MQRQVVGQPDEDVVSMRPNRQRCDCARRHFGQTIVDDEMRRQAAKLSFCMEIVQLLLRRRFDDDLAEVAMQPSRLLCGQSGRSVRTRVATSTLRVQPVRTLCRVVASGQPG